MKDIFQDVVLRLALCGLAASLAVAAVRTRIVRVACGKLLSLWQSITPLGRVVVCAAIVVAADASVKTNGLLRLPNIPRILRIASNPPRLSQSQMQFAARKAANWNVRGAWKDSFWLPFEDGWVFPHGSNHLSGVEVVSYGQVWSTPFDTNFVASAGAPFEIVRGLTSFAYELTPSNSYRFVWMDAAINRDTNDLVTAAIELFRNGDVAITTNGVAAHLPRTLPFPHDGYGQDEEWVAANFTNATEIAAAGGYAAWVDAQVGTGLTNGLYKFSAEFLDVPPEPTEFYVGDYSICVTNAGVYSFVLEKGVEYEFGTWPFNDDVDYWAQDDMAVGAPVLRSVWGGWGAPGEWTIDGGWNWLSPPSVYLGQYYNGYCSWWPTLQGTPGVPHLGAADFPKLFSAVVSDYPDPDGLSYEWHSSDDNVRIMSPHSRETLVAVDSMPTWDIFDLSVSTEINGQPYISSVHICYGTNAAPVASLKMSAPKVVFVNDDGRTSRWYRVSAQLVSPTPTNAVLAISHSGGAQVCFATDPEGRNGLVLTNVNMTVDTPFSSAGYEFFFAATNNNCTGTFIATCTLADSTVLTADGEYKVIEPLRKLVCKEQVAGGYYNPSRLVYGTNAWLKVGVNGQFSASEVQWRVVSGPGRIVSRNDSQWAVSVEPTASSGEVVVEAAFGSDSPIQPRFVLPIVEKRRVSVGACVVVDATGNPSISLQKIEENIRTANEIFSQTGVEFYLSGPILYLNEPSFSVLSEHNVKTNASGRVSTWGVCPQVTNLLNRVDCGILNATVKLVWVSRIINGTPIAFTMRRRRRCIFSANYRASDSSVPHEIGHAMGLDDIYERRKKNVRDRLADGDKPVKSELVDDLVHDWGESDGRAFYELSDTHSEIIKKCLMHGRDTGGLDIPYSRIEGFSATSSHIFDTMKVSVGASNMRED